MLLLLSVFMLYLIVKLVKISVKGNDVKIQNLKIVREKYILFWIESYTLC